MKKEKKNAPNKKKKVSQEKGRKGVKKKWDAEGGRGEGE